MNEDLSDKLTSLEEDILLAMRLGGELAPESAAEVESAEQAWDAVSENELPESLKNPMALAAKIVDGDINNVIDIAPSFVEREVEQELARAARFGSNIPEVIERRMKQDKRHAREEFQKSSSE
jgi:hypothetical protein